jgi:hypothetical protein
VISEAFPETGLVFAHELETSHPFGALPEIKVRDQQPSRAAVFRFEVFSVETEGDPSLPVLKIVERDICRVVAIGMSHDVGGVCVYVR